jgi:DNA-binding NtrC family response regulator
MDQNVLILNQSSFPCATNRCGSLVTLLQRSLRFRHIQEQSSGSLPKVVSFVPDVILLRLSVNSAAQKLIDYCREKCDRAAIFALFCPGWDQQTKEFPALLSCVDDFLSCPFQETELFLRIKRLLQGTRPTAVSSRTQELKQRLRNLPFVGESPCFLQVIEKIPLLANCSTTILISGETGSGKEVIARAIHYRGSQRGKPFIPVNCGALPDHLFENELFGHAKGAYTDAASAERGLIAEAEGGTLFLDEIDALSLSGQVKLLRFLQNGEYRPVGSSRSAIADVRVIAATNADLAALTKSRLFREDLYYRLSALSVCIPPLRERIDDVGHLSNHFLTQYAKERNTERRGISSDALRKLMTYEWPGNVRELEGVILRALVLTTSATLQAEDINVPHQSLRPTEENTLLRRAKTSMIHDFELSYLTKLLAAHHGNITHAAMAAGKQRSTLQRLLRKYSLNPKSFRV